MPVLSSRTRSNRKQTARAGTLTMIRASYRQVLRLQTTRSPRLDPLHTAPLTTADYLNHLTIHAPRKEAGDDGSTLALRSPATPAALADGCLHSYDVVYCRGNGFDHHTQVPNAYSDSQDAGHWHPRTGADPSRPSPDLWGSGTAGRSSLPSQNGGGVIAVYFLRADDQHAADWLGDAVGSLAPR